MDNDVTRGGSEPTAPKAHIHVHSREGWDAVTTRRLSTEIEFSQPVLYKHFASIEDSVEAVALEGFGELAELLSTARASAGDREAALRRVAHAYSRFAAENAGLYEAMFTRATRLQIGAEDTPHPAESGFAQLREAAANVAGERDIDTSPRCYGLGWTDRPRSGAATTFVRAATPSASSSSSPSSTTPDARTARKAAVGALKRHQSRSRAGSALAALRAIRPSSL